MNAINTRPASDTLATIQRISHVFYARQASVDWIPSDEADVFRLRFDDVAPRILKMERPDRWIVQPEQVAFPHLRARRFDEFPLVEFTPIDWREHGQPFMLMPETPWRPLDQLWNENQNVALSIARHLGHFLARLRTVDWRNIPGVVPPALKSQSYLNWYRDWLQPLRDRAGLLGPTEACLAHALELVAAEPVGFGGWQGAQILTDGQLPFTAIDWPNTGAHLPLEDVAGALGLLANFGTQAVETLRPALLASWMAGGRPSHSDRSELLLWLALQHFHRAAGHLRHGSPAEAAKEIEHVRHLMEHGFDF